MSKAQGEENYKSWLAFVDERGKDGDWQNYISGSKLNRSEIARVLGCNPKAVRGENSKLTESIDQIEYKLIESKVIKRNDSNVDGVKVREANKQTLQKSREVNLLKEKNASLRAKVSALEEQLKKYGLMDEYLEETGRWLHS